MKQNKTENDLASRDLERHGRRHIAGARCRHWSKGISCDLHTAAVVKDGRRLTTVMLTR